MWGGGARTLLHGHIWAPPWVWLYDEATPERKERKCLFINSDAHGWTRSFSARCIQDVFRRLVSLAMGPRPREGSNQGSLEVWTECVVSSDGVEPNGLSQPNLKWLVWLPLPFPFHNGGYDNKNQLWAPPWQLSRCFLREERHVYKVPLLLVLFNMQLKFIEKIRGGNIFIMCPILVLDSEVSTTGKTITSCHLITP